MKNIYISFFAVASLLLSSCTGSYDEYNKTGVDDEEGNRDGYFLSTHFVTMESGIIAQDAAQNQYTEQLLGGPYGGYFTDVRPFSAPFCTYNPESGWTESSFNFAMGTPIASYKEILKMTTDQNLLSIAKILKVMVLSRISDNYGPIPYSALETENQLTAAYDTQSEVYEEMIADLNDAIDVLTPNQTESVVAKADMFYGGKIVNWIKLANSMKLRLAMRMTIINPTLAQTTAEEAVSHSVGTMTSNDDNANYPILSGKTNPYQVGMVEWNGGDSRISADITTYMNSYNDPRRTAYFDPTLIEGYEDQYIGIRNGIDLPSQDVGQEYSNIGTYFLNKGSYVVMAASETAFLKAEGALRGWSMGGTAKDFYEEGISLSFNQWNVSGETTYIADASSTVQAYVDPRGVDSFTGTPSSITIAWDDTATTATNLERIITQKWIALFPNGLEAWSEFRRTGFPKLMPVKVNKSSVVSTERMARRLEFPQSEYTGNATNVTTAITYLGGPDNMATDLWWAKKD